MDLSYVSALSLFLSQPWSVPEVVRPLYESSAMVAQKMSMAVQHHGLHSASAVPSHIDSTPNFGGTDLLFFAVVAKSRPCAISGRLLTKIPPILW